MKPGIVTGTAWRKLALAACGLALLAGCGSGSATSDSSPSAAASATSSSAAASASSSALCADAAPLRASLNQLRRVTVQPGAVNEITSDLNDVKAALTKLVNDAHGQVQTQTSALSAALGTLKNGRQQPGHESGRQHGGGCGGRPRPGQYGGAEPPGRGEHGLPLRVPVIERLSKPAQR